MGEGILKKSGRKRNLSGSSSEKEKDPISVFCRIRPIRDDEESCVQVLDGQVLELNAPQSSNSKVQQLRCTYNKVFTDDMNQEQVFDHIGIPLAQDLLSGKNALCFMYGITGSGKTYTMNGKGTDSGVLPRTLDTVFNSIGSLQTPRCTFKPTGYNSFGVNSEEAASLDAKVKESEMEILRNNTDIGEILHEREVKSLKVNEDNNYAIFISFVEIYNNSVFDLLEDISVDAFRQPKPPSSKVLREDNRRNMFVHEVVELEVKSTEEAYTLFVMGQNRRKTALTLMNAESSRSHCVFTLRLVQAPLGPSGDSILKDPKMFAVSQLSLCDLAGSERTSRTKTDGEKIRQAGHINNSLMTLRSCLEVLRENQKSVESGGNGGRMVPYRDSKLTHLFKNYFDGDGRVNMIVCLNPRGEDFDESIHVMKFAEMTQEVKVARTEAHKMDTGLTEGRGKMAKKFKEMQETTDTESNADSVSSDMLAPLQMFPSWPTHQLAGHNDNKTLTILLDHLKERMHLRKSLLIDRQQKETELRNMLIQLDEDKVHLTQALEEQRSLLNDREKEAKSYEKKIRQVTEKCDGLQRNSHTFESQIKQLQSELSSQKDLLIKEKQEKARLKKTLKDLTSNERLRWEKECDKRVRDKEMEMEEQVMMRNEKLKQLRNVVGNLQIPEETQQRLTRINQPQRLENSSQIVIKEHTCCCHKSNGKENTAQGEEKPPCTCNASKPESRPAKAPKPVKTPGKAKTPKPKVRSRSPPPSAPRVNDAAPVRGRHRRSRSTDFLLNHKPKDTLPTDSLMQPNMKHKKTLAKLKPNQFKAASNYVLTHQDTDSSGEVCTKLVKGEILPTRSGGASVQFTDMEILKMAEMSTPPLSPSGKSSVASRAEKFERKTQKHNERMGLKRKEGAEEASEASSEDSWTSVETRCAVGIEGKPGAEPGIMHHNKKSKQ